MLGAILGAIAGPLIGGLFGHKSGGAQRSAGDQQAALGREIMNKGIGMTQGYRDAGNAANDSIMSLLGLGDNAFDQSGLQAHQLMGGAALQSNVNPFAANNFLDNAGPGQQAFNYDRTLGQYANSNAAAANNAILDNTMAQYQNTTMGHNLSGKSLAGAMQTATLTNANLMNNWAQNQISSDMNSVNSGRTGLNMDIANRQQQFNNLSGVANRGLSSIGTALTGAVAGGKMMSQGFQNQALGQQQQIAGWSNAVNNGVQALAGSQSIQNGLSNLFSGW